jgi:hypothetical protein
MTDRGLNYYYCKDCRIVVITDNEACPSTMTMQIHLGTLVLPICYAPDVPAEIDLITGEGKDRHKYVYKLVE